MIPRPSQTSWWWSDLCLTNSDPGTGANSQVKVATIPNPKMPPNRHIIRNMGRRKISENDFKLELILL